ncbi:3023_t:CDS:2, partial [Scutellospora calospora]
MINCRNICSLFFIAILCAVIFSFTTTKIVKFPQPVNGTFTGLKTWHPKIKDFDTETWYSVILFASVMLFVPGIFMLVWLSKNETLNVFVLNGEKTSTAFFNKLLAGYSISTGLIAFVVIFFDIGKLWSSVGIIHNYYEALILSVLHQGGSSSIKLHFLSIAYLLITEVAVLLLSFPYDALLFRFAGLILDTALFIQFTRMYITTKINVKEGYISLPHHTSGESEEPDRPNHPYHSPNNPKYCRLYILLLPFAALCHISGNVLTTIFTQIALANYLFAISYSFMSAYAFFVFLDTHMGQHKVKKLIFLPDNSTSSVILVTVASAALAALAVRLG